MDPVVVTEEPTGWSTGTIIIIILVIIVTLVIIGALIWFFLPRTTTKVPPPPPPGSTGPSGPPPPPPPPPPTDNIVRYGDTIKIFNTNFNNFLTPCGQCGNGNGEPSVTLRTDCAPVGPASCDGSLNRSWLIFGPDSSSPSGTPVNFNDNIRLLPLDTNLPIRNPLAASSTCGGIFFPETQTNLTTVANTFTPSTHIWNIQNATNQSGVVTYGSNIVFFNKAFSNLGYIQQPSFLGTCVNLEGCGSGNCGPQVIVGPLSQIGNTNTWTINR